MDKESVDYFFKHTKHLNVVLYDGQEVEDIVGDSHPGGPMRDFDVEELYQVFKSRLLHELLEKADD